MVSRAETNLGYDSTLMSFYKNPLSYKLKNYTGNPVLRELVRWKQYRESFLSFDHIHFNNGQTFLPSRINIRGNFAVKCLKYLYNEVYARKFELDDLRYAYSNNKYITVTFQGTDARQLVDKYGNENPLAKNVPKDYFTQTYDSIKRHRIQQFDQYADRIFYLNPDLARYLPDRAEFLPYGTANLDGAENLHKKTHKKMVLLHAPTNPQVKGSMFIRDAISNLQKQRSDFDYIEVTNRSHREIQDLMLKADLLIDQLLVGWYGGIAVEFMSLNKPVLAYINQNDLQYVPAELQEDLPILNADRGNIGEKIQNFLDGGLQQTDPQNYVNFVSKWHSPNKIARIINDTQQSSVN